MNILHVEQSQMIQASVSESVSKMGHNIYASHNSIEAFKILQNREIHFIICGLELADTSCDVLVEDLKRSSYQDVPVVVLAPRDNREIREKLFAFGVVDYLVHDGTTEEKLCDYLESDKVAYNPGRKFMTKESFRSNDGLKITTIYIILGCLWILLSDKIMAFLFHSKEMIVLLSMLKGWVYVVLSGIIIYTLVSKAIENTKNATIKLNDSYQELSKAHQELKEAYTKIEEYNYEMDMRLNESQAMEVKLQNSEARLRAFFDVIPDLMFKLDGEGIFLDYMSSEDDKLFAPPEAFMGKNIKDVLPPHIVKLTMQHMQLGFETNKVQTYEYRLEMHGKDRHYEARLFVSGENEATLLIRDITVEKRMELELKYNSLHDELTGLSNRTNFEEKMAFFEKTFYGSVGLMIGDIDGLKFINDTMGHSTGDKLLIDVAGILKAIFKDSDLIARIGGDEFAAIIPDCNEETLEGYRREFMKRVRQSNKKMDTPIISISLGFAIKEDETRKMHDVFTEANSNMYREKLNHRQSARSAVVQSLMKTLEVRDFATEKHASRLQQYVLTMAEELNLHEDTINNLQLLAQFHDIGKLGIPDRILLKHGPLTPSETKSMQAHSEIGYKIALCIPDLGNVSNLILKHHEWWNGKGYPLGLKQEEIPMECRILSIADAYDAMISDRPYRAGMTQEEAKEQLVQNAGIQFDPKLVEIFLGILENEFVVTEQ